jgi:phosphate transport system substrate-binding protein
MSGSGAGSNDSSMAGGMGSTGSSIQRKGRSNTPLIAALAVVIVILLVVVAGYSAGWFKTASTTSKGTGGCTLPTPGSLVGTGSTLVAPLMDVWESVYWTGTIVNYNALGSSAGITAITKKTVDYGASDAPLNGAQRGAAPGVLTVPESAGGVVPIYDLSGTGVTNLKFTGQILAQMFDGNLTMWNNSALQALNPTAHLPSTSITIVHRSDGSGTTFIWTSFLSAENTTWAHTWGKGTAWPTNITNGTQVGQAHNAGVAAYVQENPNTLGYVDLNYALSGGASVGIGSVKNPTGNYIVANVTNTASALADSPAAASLPVGSGDWYNVSLLNAPGAGDYPVTSLTYVFVYQNLSKAYSSYTLNQAENLVDFLHWIITSGQVYSKPLAYVPLPLAITAADNVTLNSITFDGNAIPVCVPT